MPLSRRDLEAIRRIVREELARLGPQQPDVKSTLGNESAPASDMPAPMREALEAFARASATGTADERLRAEAHYRAHFDSSFQKRARTFFGKAADALITDEEMATAMKAWSAQRAQQRARRKLGPRRPSQ